jgi:hypothetical protein
MDFQTAKKEVVWGLWLQAVMKIHSVQPILNVAMPVNSG